MADLDDLVIKVQGKATSAINALDKLCVYLDRLETSLSKIDGNSLHGLSRGIDSLSGAMSRLNQSGVKTQDFTRLKSNIENLSTINFGGLTSTSQAIVQMANAIQTLAGASSSSTTTTIADLVNGIGKLGGVSVQRAITNIPFLTSQLSRMMAELAKAPTVSNNLIQMVNAMANLASQGQKVGSASNSIVKGLNNYSTAAHNSTRKSLSLASAIGKFYASYFLVVRGIKGLWSSIESSMDYVETFNYFNVTIDKIGDDFKEKYKDFGYESAEAYANSFTSRLEDLATKMTGYSVGSSGELSWANTKNLGLDPNQLMNFQARLGAVTNSVGLFGEASITTSKALSMLSADLSSLTNTELDTVMTNLSSGLIGQSRALYKYGIDITNATLSTYALANGIEKSVSEMTQSEKMQLRVLAILDQSKVAWGDQANTINSVANQYRIFTQQVKNLGRILGNLFLPIVQKVLPMVNGLIIALSNLFTTLGVKIYGDTWLTDLMDGISGGASATDDLVDGIDDLDDGLEDASKSAGKLKKQLQGFDELNVLSTDTSTSNSSLGGVSVIDLSAQIESALGEYESVWNKAFGSLENKAIEFSKKTETILEPVKKIFEDFANGDFLQAGKDTSKLISALFNWIAESIDKVDWEQLGRNIGEYLEGLDWEEILNSVGKAIWEALKAVFEIWKGAFEEDPLDTLILTFAGISFLLKSVGALTGATLTGKLASALGLTPVAGGLYQVTLGIALTLLISKLWVSSDTFKKTEKAIGSTMATTFSASTQGANLDMQIMNILFGNKSKASEEKAVEYGSDIGTNITAGVEKGVEESEPKTSKGIGSTIFEGIYKSLKIAFGIHSPAKEMYPIGENILLGIKEGFVSSTDKFTSYSSIFESNVENTFKSSNWTFNGVREGLDKTFGSAIDSIKEIWNKFAEWFNEKLDFSWDSVTVFGKEIIPKGSISLGKLPTFANGGFVTSDVFFANENGIPELVGTVGGRTAVASGTEITGISDAVYDTGATQASLLNTAVQLLQVIASNGNGVSDDYIFNSFRNSARQYTARTGNPAIPI